MLIRTIGITKAGTVKSARGSKEFTMRKCLITVDYQVDFVNGSLGFDGAEKLENVIAEKIEKYRAEGADIIFTLDTHQCDYLTTFEGRILPIEHCIEYTKGHELYGKIKSMVQPNDKVFKKCTYGSEALFDYLRKCDYKEIELCGLVSNICVISNAVLARTALPNARLTVDSNATASNDDGLNTAALNVMRGLGTTVI